MHLKPYRRGKIWHYRGSIAGRRLRGTTGTESKELAQQIIARIESDEWKRILHGPEAVLKFSDAALLYRAAKKSTRFIEPIEDYWKDTLVKDIKPGMIRQMAIELYPTQSGATRNRQAIIPCQSIINNAAESELCPRIRVRRFPTVRKIKKPATLEWCRAFMEAANQPHLGALALFMFLTAARITEALNVKWDDIDFEQQTVLLRETKVSEERQAHLPSELLVAIANIKRDRPTVFRYVDRASAEKEWRKVVKRNGLERFSFHCCRHGFATSLLRSGVDPKTVMTLGGWADPKLFMDTYAHAINDMTLTDRLIDTNMAHEIAGKIRKRYKIS